MNMFFEIIGWVGTAPKTYQYLNLVGAVGVGVNSLVHHALPSVGINLAWMLIAIYALIRSEKLS